MFKCQILIFLCKVVFIRLALDVYGLSVLTRFSPLRPAIPPSHFDPNIFNISSFIRLVSTSLCSQFLVNAFILEFSILHKGLVAGMTLV